MEILDFINNLRKTDKYVAVIFSEGSCYKFSDLLCKMYPGARSFIIRNHEYPDQMSHDHAVTKYQGKYYDINGIVPENEILDPIEPTELHKNWGFDKWKCLGAVCPECEAEFFF